MLYLDEFFQIGTITCATFTSAVSCSMAEFLGHCAKVKKSSLIFHLFLSEIISSSFIREESLQRSLSFICTLICFHLLNLSYVYHIIFMTCCTMFLSLSLRADIQNLTRCLSEFGRDHLTSPVPLLKVGHYSQLCRALSSQMWSIPSEENVNTSLSNHF